MHLNRIFFIKNYQSLASVKNQFHTGYSFRDKFLMAVLLSIERSRNDGVVALDTLL